MIDRSVIVRTQLVLLLCLFVSNGKKGGFGCEALQYQAVENFATTEECALVLEGPGRSSAYDYTYNLLRGSPQPSAGSHTCITYDAVNRAYVEARKRINVAQPQNEAWRPEDLASVGELLLDISTNLANTYGLSYEEIQKSLPLIDTSKTLIREVCPAYLSDVECRAGKYRRYDGLCTNLKNPTWGSSLSPFTRLLDPAFADGLSAPRISVTGNDLPLSRVVSRTMHPDEGFHDHAGTVMVIAWGQFMDHDYTLTATPLDAMNRNDPEECCNRPPHQKNPYCNEIIIPEDDYFYKLFGVRCMDFVRAFPAPRPGCRLGSRVPFNLLTGVLDGNTVYGVSETFSRKLRTGYGGLLRMNPVFSEYGLKDLLPLKLDIPDEGCTRPNRSMYCFEAGEIRVNEQLVLTCMHTLLAREHNRAAKALSQVNPHWDDETIFQESRRITIAEIQHITYNEFLPILLGKDVMEKFGLLLEKHNYWDGYDPNVNPGVIDAFAAAAFRFGHSLLPTAVERWSKAHKFIASKRLSDLIRRPWDLYRAGVLDEYFMGLMNQVAQAMDDSITQEVTNHLFKKVGARYGMDLVSLNMQRGREFGIPSYMEFRKFCGLPGADTFEELFGSMPNETIRRYSSIFQHPSDVDLWSGGVSERPLPGSMLGPTFACVIATQFSYSRRGDRFWYELPNQPSSFTIEQLNEIRKARLARLICDNTDLIDTIQLYPMVLPDHEINPRVPCRSGVLPGIDFTKWAEYPTTNHAEQYRMKSEASSPSLVLAMINKINQRTDYQTTKSLLDRLFKGPKPISNVESKIEKKPKKIFENSWQFVNYLRPNNGHGDVIKISTIVERIRERSKRNAVDDIDVIVETKSKSSRREKRSTNNPKISIPYFPATKFPENVSQLAMFYRDPQSTIEHQQQPHHYQPLNLTSNDEPPKIRNSREKNSKSIKKNAQHTYNPIFRECNDSTSASEIEDLNIPPPRPKYLKPKNPYIPEIDELKNHDDSIIRKNSNDPRNFVATTESPKVDARATTTDRSKDAETKTYVNLRDHQEEARKILSRQTNATDDVSSSTISGMVDDSEDIPVYNPDDIPYVEVPDYTDRLEESLDEDDRRLADIRANKNPEKSIIDEFVERTKTMRMSDDKRESDDDVVDPDGPVVSDVITDPGKNPERTSLPRARNKETGKSESSIQGHVNSANGDDERRTLSFATLPYAADILLGRRANSTSDDKNGDATKLRSHEATRDASVEELEEPEIGGKSDEVETKFDEGHGDDDDSKKIADFGEVGEAGNRNKDDDEGVTDFRPVEFDINDYVKPFDYHKLFNNDDETDVDDSHDFSDRLTDHSVGKVDSSDELSLADIYSANYGNDFVNDSRGKIDANGHDDEEIKYVEFVKPEEFRFGDKNFFKPISTEEREKSDRFISQSDFLSDYFGDDGSDDTDVEVTTRKGEESSKESYETLSSVSKKKDFIPKFEVNGNRRSKNGKPRSGIYNDFWTLEYAFPAKKMADDRVEKNDGNKMRKSEGLSL